jgi:hypothetical protein
MDDRGPHNCRSPNTGTLWDDGRKNGEGLSWPLSASKAGL